MYQNMIYYTNMNNIYMVYWHIMVVPVKFSLWFNLYKYLQIWAELIADKMQNLRINQEPEGTYKTDLHE